ncbi:hypothetical protein [Micromonospora sp. NPDC050200]|uniref:hypothetical protein n=1 Tax=Micromonospora sp. NPDC050200 TaxID=3155664 RepID=UPI0033EAED7A
MTATSFDDHERERWAGRGAAYERSFGRLCAYRAGVLLDGAGAGAGMRVLDVGTGRGTVAALAAGRGAEVGAALAFTPAAWRAFVTEIAARTGP